MKKNENALTYLGKETSWEGKLDFSGSLNIDGNFKGEISSDGNLIVGESALIEGDIHVSYLVNYGEIHGNIISDQRVDIHAPGKVFGSIQTPTVVIDQGVIFEGTTRMYRAKGSEDAQSDIVKLNEYDGGPPPNLTAIFGVVTDKKTGEPIKNAKVDCKGKESVSTNASGYYEFINLTDGTWKLKVKVKGYKKGVAKVEIKEGGTFKQNCELIPK